MNIEKERTDCTREFYDYATEPGAIHEDHLYWRGWLRRAELAERVERSLAQSVSDSDKELAAMRERADERIEQLEAELAEIRAAHAKVMSEACPADERHCSCVPFLRAELARVRTELDEARKWPVSPKWEHSRDGKDAPSKAAQDVKDCPTCQFDGRDECVEPCNTCLRDRNMSQYKRREKERIAKTVRQEVLF